MQENLESKRVIVRIWTSTNNPEHQSGNFNQSDIGHISIEFLNMQLNGDSIYISLWPQPNFTRSQAATKCLKAE